MADPPHRQIRAAERLAWLRLIRSDNIGPITFRNLLAHFGEAEAALEAVPRMAQRGGRRKPLTLYPEAAAERELAALEALGGRAITLIEPDYPEALAAIPDPPPVIMTLGNGHLLARKAVAVVGARNASANGRRLARDLAAGLGGAGFLVASGLARGIDAAAHNGALESGTVAVMAGGVDVVYPRENQELYEQVAAQGLLVSEIAMGTTPQASHFPRRNRLISGLSLGVVVVEAAPRSGSLITARQAAEQGREVFAVPGSPLDPRARGCNGLIRQGATLVESAADVVDALAGMLRPSISEPPERDFAPAKPPETPESELATCRATLEDLLSPTPVPVDELIRQCQLSPAVVRTVLLELELAGRIERHPGNRVASVA
ncbi:MAG: DNA-processing protein DprA [Pseudomonadota bacterium]